MDTDSTAYVTCVLKAVDVAHISSCDEHRNRGIRCMWDLATTKPLIAIDVRLGSFNIEP
jgi:hypothetical protein